ncbi:unnamed protein product, partial [Rotaria sordida]
MKALSIDKKTCHLTEKEKEAQCYFDLGDELCLTQPDKALEFSKKSLEIRLQILPEDHATIGFCHQDIGAAYESKTMFDEATEHYKKAIEIYEKRLFDEEEYQFNIKELYARCHNTIGRLSFNPNDYDIAVEYYKKCLDFYENLMKTNVTCDYTNEISSCLINLSGTYIHKKEYKLALDCLKKANNMLPDNDIRWGFYYLNMGVCYASQKKYEEGIENYQKAIQILEKNLPTAQEDYALCYVNMGACY